MRSTVLLFIILFYSCASVFAQDENTLLINSGEIITNGLQAHEKGDYKTAIDYYKQVTRNDTNYVVALAELAVSYSADSQFAEVVKVSLEALKDPQGREYLFYNYLGSAYDGLKQTDKAIQAFQKGLTFAPYDYSLWFNLGVTYEGMKDMDKTYFAYKKALQYNPFHPGSLNRLGKMELAKGNTVTAMLSFYMSLISNPTSKYVISNVTELNNISLVKLDVNNGSSSRKSDNFYDIELLISSKIALSTKFKNETKIADAVINQTQMVIDRLQYNTSDTGYYMKNYVPFFVQIRDEKKFPVLIYRAFSGLNSEKIQAAIKKNEKQIEAFRKWIFEYFDQKRSEQIINLNGSPKATTFDYYRSNRVMSIGNFNYPKAIDRFQIGKWVYFYENGYKEAEGEFNQSGKKEGEWRHYYYNGILKNVFHYTNGILNGTFEEYFENGQLNTTCNVVDDKAEGLVKIYNEVGSLRIDKNMKNSLQDGITKEYYSNGNIEGEYKLVEDMFQGEQVVYYSNGKVKRRTTYLNNKKNGESLEYYDSGNLKSKGSYKDGQMVGVWLTYYENKTILDSGAYNTLGAPIGTWVMYHDNGKLERNATYDIKGKKHGNFKEYDTDGKLFCSYVYAEGRITEYAFYNKTGAVVQSAKEKGGTLAYKGYYPDGKTLSHEGIYKNGLEEGEWKTYNQNNYLEGKYKYEKGNLNGLSTEYYSSGVIKSEIMYKDGSADGLYKLYYSNKQLNEIGNYVDGVKQGYWIGYWPNGKKSFEYYYLNGERDKYNTDYTVRGIKETEDYLEFGFLKQTIIFDTLGNALSTSKFVRGNGELKYIYPNGKIRTQSTFKNGMIEGTASYYYSNGKLEEKVAYVKGEKTGSVMAYDQDGKLTVTGTYKNNLREGKWTYYYPSGIVETVGFYKKGEKDSLWTNYFENGNKSDDAYWSDGLPDGNTTFYSPDIPNAVIFVRKFVKNYVVNYSYPGKDGKLVQPIPVLNETVDYKAYYPSGLPSIQFSIVAGMRQGRFIKYYSSGQKYQECTYVTAEREGHVFEFYPSGSVKTDDNYFYDEKNGICKSYYANGTVKSIEQYVYGVLNGTATYFDQSGKLIKKVIYRDGIIY